MSNLFDGVKEFHDKDFESYRSLFHRLGRKQEPHTLFIGCSDSRVVPTLITRALPGELFVVRNIANIVPYYRDTNEFVATTSAIEYAVLILNVENIVVCGHSNCGGCNALLKPDGELAAIPHTKRWLELAGNVRRRILSETIPDRYERERRTEQLNIVEQMSHLTTYPYIAEKCRNDELRIYGWYFSIETGDVFNYTAEEERFVRIS